MKKFLNGLVNGGSSLSNGFIALVIIGLIALGCTCNKDLGLSSDSNSSSDKKTETSGDDLFGDKKSEDKEKEKEEYSKDKVPSSDASQEIAKTTLLNFNDAVTSGDFSDFHKTIAKSWQRSSRPSTFEKGFSEFIEKKVNIGAIRSQEADFSPSPKIDKKYGQQVLFLEGRYDIRPRPVKFKLEYIFEDDDWKLVLIDVNTK
ncbi:MAG: hypothetical protein R2681_14415 [Pyrinomonadaceae bacterium]